MEAKQQNIWQFISQHATQFFIPVYQRNYDWQEKQCRQLWQDMLEAGKTKKTHFFGSIVSLKNSGDLSGDINRCEIIDGQQRLTTLTLLLLAVNKFYKKKGQPKDAEEIYNTYLINQYDESLDNNKVKLKATENNQNVILSLLKDSANLERECNITRNFNFFKKKISEENIADLMQGFKQLIIVEVALEKEKDDPQKIFESFNSTGLALSQADLIRNYILMDLSRLEQEEIFRDYWMKIEENCRDENIKKDNLISDFIRDFITVKKNYIPKKSEVYEKSKDYFSEKDYNDLKEKLAELKKYSAYYNKFINPKKEPDKQLQELFQDIKNLKVTVIHPFLLQVYNDFQNEKISKENFVKVLNLLQSFIWRRYIVGYPTNFLDKFFMALHKKVDLENYFVSLKTILSQNNQFPNDKQITEFLKIKGIEKYTKYFLYKLEHHNNKEKVNIDNLTIEHIFPQSSEKWQRQLGEDYAVMKEKLQIIGNLTLSGNNASLGNKIFSEKRDHKPNGYKDSRLWLNSYLSELEKFSVAELEERTKIITQRFFEIWEAPSQIVASSAMQEVNIFSIEDATDKRIEYIKIGEEIIANEGPFVNFYVEFFNILKQNYNKDFPTKTNSSSNQKLKDMRDALTELGLEDCYIKFV